MISTDNEEVSKWLNLGKDVLLDKLVKDQVLTKEQAGDISKSYLMSSIRKNHLTESIKKLWPTTKKDDDNMFVIVASKL